MGKKKRQADHSLAGDSSDSNGENEAKTNAPSCVHLSKAVVVSSVRKSCKSGGLPTECFDCKRFSKTKPDGDLKVNGIAEEVTMYICLRCGACRCKGGANHAENHSKNCQNESHDIALDPLDWKVWCFKCQVEIPTNSTKVLYEVCEVLRKQSGRSITADEETKEPEDKELPIEIPPINYTASILMLPVAASEPEQPLPKVRGLANLGNTCFFNAVLQCLAQTPFLLPILEEMREPGERFTLPGGEVQVGEEKIKLEPLEGSLNNWKPLTQCLAETLRELQSGKSDTYSPRALKLKLQDKCPQFAGYNEHDSQELLRQLLDCVRNEDQDRYKQGILKAMQIATRNEVDNLSNELKLAVRAYGRQAGDLLLRPSQVFRGELVSTLQCQKCDHVSDHVEHFLDLSLPVAAEKPVHIRRRVNSEDSEPVSKHQMKKERARMNKRRSKNNNSYVNNNNTVNKVGDGGDGSGEDDISEMTPLFAKSDAESDADNEDEAEADAGTAGRVRTQPQDVIESGYSSEKPGNGDSPCGSPQPKPVERNADTRPRVELNESNRNEWEGKCEYTGRLDETSSLLSGFLERVEPGAAGHVNKGPGRSLDPGTVPPRPLDPIKVPPRPEFFDISSVPPAVIALPPPPTSLSLPPTLRLDHIDAGMGGLSMANEDHYNGEGKVVESELAVDTPLDSEGQGEGAVALESPRDETVECASPDPDKPCAGATLAPRAPPASSSGCTIITCLKQFTAQELMSGNNKVGCEDCTERINGKDGKTVYTDASKQLLILNPPAILILHLKRFQVSRFSSRKNCEEVNFPTVLDLASFCSVKCKNGGLVRSDQTEVRYSLYGVVQHTGGMHGGHYVAYVKVRAPLSHDDPRWAYLPAGPSRYSPVTELPSDSDGPPEPPPGKWYYVSDSHVSEVAEKRVLSSEAYLLFYERIW